MQREDLLAAIDEIPLIDIHSHLPSWNGRANVKGLIGYHMLQYALRATGNVEFEHIRDRERNTGPSDEVLDAWTNAYDAMHFTGFGWAITTILRDLYDFNKPISRETLPELEARVRDCTDRDDWPLSVMQKGRIEHVVSQLGHHRKGEPNDYSKRFTPSCEYAPITCTYESWSWKERIDYQLDRTGIHMDSLAALRQVTHNFFRQINWTPEPQYADRWRGQIDIHPVFVSWIASTCDFRPTGEAVIDEILDRARNGKEPSPDEDALLNAAVVRAMLDELRSEIKVVQFCYGAQFLSSTNHPVQRAGSEFTSTLGYLFDEYPELHFNLLNGYEADEPVLCSHCLGYKNVSLGGHWWHLFYPSVMQTSWHRRLDVVPATRLMGFFSDGYCVDWVYGRSRMVRQVLANVLYERIESGFCTAEDALSAAKTVLHDTPKAIMLDLKPTP